MSKRYFPFIFLGVAACAAGPELPKAQPGTSGDLAQAQTLLEKANAMAAAARKKEDIEPTLKAYEEVLAVAPDQRDALIAAARLRYMHGNDVLDGSNKDALLATYLKGREYGLRAMALNPEFRAAYEKDSDMQKHVQLLQKDDAHAIYWAGLNWAKWGELYGILRAAIDIPKVKALMDRASELDPTYEGNGVDRFFMGYWVAIPGFAGRDPEKSKAAYERAIKMSPQCNTNHVTFAYYYARDKEDRILFDSLLKKAIDAPEEPAESEFGLLNALAREEAKRYMGKAKEWFE